MNKHQTLKTISSRFARTLSLNGADVRSASQAANRFCVTAVKEDATDHDKRCGLKVQNTPPPERSCAGRGAQNRRTRNGKWMGPRGPCFHTNASLLVMWSAPTCSVSPRTWRAANRSSPRNSKRSPSASASWSEWPMSECRFSAVFNNAGGGSNHSG